MPHPSDAIKRLIESNATEVVRLHQRIRETLASRDKSPEAREEWRRACAAFHARYDELAFPGGYTGALNRLIAGDPKAMEAAICFLELRPYFFRSGYMFDALIRKAKHAPLSVEQRARLQYVTERWRDWKEKKDEMQPQPEFQIGQRVSVLTNARNHTDRVGKIARVVWHHKDASYNYYLEVDGKKVSKRYLACDLTSVHAPEQDTDV